MKAYAHNRSRLGKRSQTSAEELASYQAKIEQVRKSYNIDEKICGDDVEIDKIMASRLKISWRDYIDLTMQCWSGAEDVLVMSGQY